MEESDFDSMDREHLDRLFGDDEEEGCPHNNIRSGHHPDQPDYCVDCGEDL